MLISDKPKRVVSQAPLKDGTCFAGCGAPIQYRTNPRVYCPPCKKAKVLATARISMEKQRRKSGIERVLGKERECQDCNAAFTVNRSVTKIRCDSCQLKFVRAKARAASLAKWKDPEGRKAILAWQREKRETDPAWKVTAHLRTLMHRALGSKKAGRSWREFVPYSLEELMTHLERQFLPGMTWDNRGDWHIDHIIARKNFNYSSPDDPEFQACWALSNLRPLWARDNIRKNDRRTHLM